MELKAKDVMTADVLTVSEDWLIDQLAEFFIEHGISGAPVISEDGLLIGVVSVTDIARFNSLPVRENSQDPHEYFTQAGLALARDEFPSYHIDSDDLVNVRDIMTPAIFSVDKEDSVPEVADMMVRGRVHRVFVTQGKEIIGVISALDLLKLLQISNETGKN